MIKPARLEKQKDGSIKAFYRLSDLTLDDNNARAHGERDLEAIADSVRQFDQQKPIVIDAEGIVRAGNGTCLALIEKGIETVWAVQSRLKGAQAVGYALADNRTAELSTWDYQIVSETLKALEAEGQDITRLGWEQHELDGLLKVVNASDDDGGDNDSSPKLGALEYRIIIECNNEKHQAKLLQKLEAEGLQCRALIS